MLLLLPFAIAVLPGCGDSDADSAGGGQEAEAGDVNWLVPPRPIEGLEQRTVGDGARAAVVLWREGAPPPRQAVVFLHAWYPVPPFVYADWLRHLAVRGNSIVYPAYQEGGEPREEVLGNALAGIAAGLRAVRADPDSLVAVGQTAGGALAFDYAASAPAPALDIPGPRGVLAVYPGRFPAGKEIPPADLSRIPSQTTLEVISGPGNPVPGGEAQARELLAEATRVPPSRKRYLVPRGTGPAATLWAPLDRLIAAVRGSS